MNESKTKKKAMAIFVLVFLCCGGGVFLFLVFQGLGEYKPGNSNFHYGSGGKSALTPLLNFFSSSDSEAKLVKKAKGRMEHRGLDMSLLDGSRADVSDWMAKGGTPASGGKASGGARGGAAASGKAIPGMGGGLGGAGMGGGGGGSQTSGGLSALGTSGKNDNTTITNGGAGSDIGDKGKGTMGALNATRAYMKEGLRSGSAMTAKSKWDQGFGAVKGKAAGGQLAYNKAGLVKLDTIKKFDVSDLKNIEPKSLSGAVPPPVEDKSATDELAAKVKGRDGGDAAKDAAEQVNKNNQQLALTGGGGGGDDKRTPPGGGKLGVMPDPDTIKAAVDQFCPRGCDPGDGSNYKDSQISWERTPDGKGFRATFEGTHDGVPYKDTMDVVKGADGQMQLQPVGSCIQSGGSWQSAEFGTSTLSGGGSGGGGGFSCN